MHEALLQDGELDTVAFAQEVFPEFIYQVNPKFNLDYRHVERLSNVCQRIADGELKRVMVWMPPRHGKSEQISRLFSAYYLNRYKDRFVGINSYAADIAYNFSRNARENYKKTNNALKYDASAVKHWETEKGGGMWAAGVGGPITGKGFHLGIIDDPLKNAEEASSRTIRAKQKEWYKSTFYTRMEPGAAIIIIMTRWHADDLCGWLLSREADHPEHWHIVNFEAIKTETAPQIPDTCTYEEDNREPGEALCPERYDLDALIDIQQSVGSYFWAAMYQQRPAPEEGGIWQKWFIPVPDADFPAPGAMTAYGTDWDLAYTKDDDNSASAYVTSGRIAEKIYIDDFGFAWKEFPELITWMREHYSPHYIEQKASGKSAKQVLSREGITAIEVPVQGGDKEARARFATPKAEAGMVYVRKSILERLYTDPRQGILFFPRGEHDDVADTLAQALQRHSTGNTGKKIAIKGI